MFCDQLSFLEFLFPLGSSGDKDHAHYVELLGGLNGLTDEKLAC